MTTSEFPPAQHALYPPTTPAVARRGGRLVAAALLVGALAGGAAGVGGAAVLAETWSPDTSPPASAAGQPAPLSTSSGGDSSAPEGTPEAAAAEALPSVVKIYATSATQSGSGSGIVLTEDGEILTNNHVVELAASGGKLAVSFDDGRTAAASIVGRDPLTDLAVIDAAGVSGLTPATLGDSDSLDVGEQVVAVGAPLGLESTVTAGIVSALNRPVTASSGTPGDPATIFPAIQTDAAINPGNSGGPLVDLAGHVVGIDSAIKSVPSTAGTSSGSIGLGFAIPINDAIPIVQQLRRGDTATHARIGVTVTDATDDIGLPGGAIVQGVTAGSPGAETGLAKGDVITRVDQRLVSDSDSLVATIRSYRPGDTVTLTITASKNGVRTSQTSTTKVTLGSDAT